jgi:hypothetical protein
MRVLKLAGEDPQAVQRERVVYRWPTRAASVLHGGAVAFREMIEDVAFLVADTALHRDWAEDLIDGRPQRLGSVEDDEDALLDVKAAPADEIGEEMRCDGLVLRGAIPQSQRELHPIGADAQRDNAAAALQLDPVDHQRRQAHISEITAHQRVQVLPCAADELAADRGLRRRPLPRAHLLTDGAHECVRSGVC